MSCMRRTDCLPTPRPAARRPQDTSPATPHARTREKGEGQRWQAYPLVPHSRSRADGNILRISRARGAIRTDVRVGRYVCKHAFHTFPLLPLSVSEIERKIRACASGPLLCMSCPSSPESPYIRHVRAHPRFVDSQTRWP